MFRLGLGSFFLFLPLVFLVFAGGLLLTNGIFPGLALLPQAGGRPFPFAVLPEFPGALGLRANLARSLLPGLTGHFFLSEVEPPTLYPFLTVCFLRVNLSRSVLTHSGPPFPPGGWS